MSFIRAMELPDIAAVKRVFAILFGISAVAAAQTATINVQIAIVSTQQGQQAAARMKKEWGPQVVALEAKEAELKADREKLETESKQVHGWWLWRHAINSKEKARRGQELDARAKVLVKERERGREGVQVEQRRVVGQIGQRMIPIMQKYAKEHGYSVVLDSGQQEGPVIVALSDITSEIVKLYDQAYPGEP
jgi:outer membrane protein